MTFSALLAICAGNSLVTGEFPAQRPVTRSFDVFFERMKKRLSKLWRGWWFETPLCPLLHHCDVNKTVVFIVNSYRKIRILDIQFTLRMAIGELCDIIYAYCVMNGSCRHRWIILHDLHFVVYTITHRFLNVTERLTRSDSKAEAQDVSIIPKCHCN